jgi:hypothetical protein
MVKPVDITTCSAKELAFLPVKLSGMLKTCEKACVGEKGIKREECASCMLPELLADKYSTACAVCATEGLPYNVAESKTHPGYTSGSISSGDVEKAILKNLAENCASKEQKTEGIIIGVVAALLLLFMIGGIIYALRK